MAVWVWLGPKVADGGGSDHRPLDGSLADLGVVGRHDCGRPFRLQGGERSNPLGVHVVLLEYRVVYVPKRLVAGRPLLLGSHACDLHGQLTFGYARGFFDEIAVWRPGDVEPAKARAGLLGAGVVGGAGEFGGPVDTECGVEAVETHGALVDQADEIRHRCEMKQNSAGHHSLFGLVGFIYFKIIKHALHIHYLIIIILERGWRCFILHVCW